MYDKVEIRDFKCSFCGTKWLKYIENKNPCRNSLLEDVRHNFDFGNPIKIEPQEKQTSTPKVPKGKVTFK